MKRILKKKNSQKTPQSSIVTIDGERLNAFLLQWETRQEWLFSPFLLHIVLGALITRMQGKEVKGIQIGNEDIKLLLLANDKFAYVKNFKESKKMI